MPKFPTRNLLLSKLSDTARSAFGEMDTVSFELRDQLEIAHRPIEFAYFPEDCLVSMVMSSQRDGSIEIGMVGFEGVTAIPAIEGDDRSPFDSFIQGAGTAHRISVEAFRKALETNAEVRSVMLSFARTVTIQVAGTAFANGKSKLESRLARWLLMVGDRQGSTFKITHEFLATMLAVRRSGVTLAMQILEGKGLIRASRGAVAILDRDGLIEHADGAYGLPESEYDRLIGPR